MQKITNQFALQALLRQSQGSFHDSCQSQEIPDAYADERTFFRHQVPKKFQLASLEKCDKNVAYVPFAKAWAKKPSSLFLFGGVGSGKTFFAFAMLREMFKHSSIWPKYYTSPALDGILLEALKSDQGDKWRIQDLAAQDLLFIDDIGRETKSERLKRQYFEILNYRYVNELPTILTSNFNLDQLGEILDAAIASRLQEWQFLEFDGPDLRSQIAMKNAI